MVGWLSTNFGTLFTFVPMAVIALVAMAFAYAIWPKQDDSVLAHSHDDLMLIMSIWSIITIMANMHINM